MWANEGPRYTGVGKRGSRRYTGVGNQGVGQQGARVTLVLNKWPRHTGVGHVGQLGC